jgi:hypothetical protein
MPSIIPIEPEWPISERYEWLTDIIEHRDGTEQRTQVRVVPRQTFEFSYHLSQVKKPLVYNSLFNNLRGEWYIPMWPYMQSVGDIIADQTEISCDTTITDFEDTALLYGPAGYEVVSIDSQTDTTITLTAGASALDDAYIMPIRTGFISGDPKFSTSGLSGRVSVSFVVQDVSIISAPTPSQYDGEDIYTDPGVKDGTFVEHTLSQLQEVNDFGIGLVSQSSPWLNLRHSAPLDTIVKTRDDLREYEQFLFRRAGKYRGFYRPSFDNDMRLQSTGAITTTIDVENDELESADNIAVLDTSGTWYLRGVTDVTEIDADTVRLTIDSSLGIDASAVACISFLRYNRLDNDLVDIKHMAPGIARSQVRVTSI